MGSNVDSSRILTTIPSGGVQRSRLIISFRKSQQLIQDTELTMCFRIMSEEERSLVHLARTSAQRHMSLIISNPELYLATFRYGMDFVWGMFYQCLFQ